MEIDPNKGLTCIKRLRKMRQVKAYVSHPRVHAGGREASETTRRD